MFTSRGLCKKFYFDVIKGNDDIVCLGVIVHCPRGNLLIHVHGLNMLSRGKTWCPRGNFFNVGGKKWSVQGCKSERMQI